MKEYYTRQEAVDLCLSYQHLIDIEFTTPKSGITYYVNFIHPVPASDERGEFNDLVIDFIQTGSLSKLVEFDSMPRKNEFIPVLFARSDKGTDAILLSAVLCQFVGQDGQIKLGFEVYSGHWLY